MRLTTKGRYAVTAMLDIALHADQGSISLSDISDRQNISLSYLEQLFAKLRRHNLVLSIRGPGGGYQLNKSSNAISIAHIIDAVDESLDVTNCNSSGACQQGMQCLTHHLWCDLSEQIHNFLHGITLATLIQNKEVKVIAERQDQAQLTTIISSLGFKSESADEVNV